MATAVRSAPRHRNVISCSFPCLTQFTARRIAPREMVGRLFRYARHTSASSPDPSAIRVNADRSGHARGPSVVDQAATKNSKESSNPRPARPALPVTPALPSGDPLKPLIGRIPVLDVTPLVDCGTRPAKAVSGETFQVTATVFREGHDAVAANVVLTDPAGRPGPWTPMRELAPGTDRWGADVTPDRGGRLELHRRGVERSGGHLAPPRRHQDPGGDRHRPRPGGGRASCTSVPPPAYRRRTAARRCSPPSTRCATRTSRRRAALAAALAPAVDEALARHPLRELVTASGRRRCSWSGSGRCTAPGTSCSRAPRARSSRRASRRSAALSGRPRNGCPPSPRWASTSSTCRRSTPSARRSARAPTTPSPRPRRCRRALGDRLPEGGHDAVHPDLGTIEDFDAFVRAGPRPWDGGRAGLRAPVLAGPPLGREAAGVVPPPRRRHDRLRGEPAEEVPGHLSDRLRPDMRGLVRETVRILRYWMTHGVRIFRVDNPHTKPVVFWEKVIGNINRPTPMSSSWPRLSPGPR